MTDAADAPPPRRGRRLEPPVPIAILASHGGSNMRAIVAACQSHYIPAIPQAIISNNRGSAALAWAEAQGLAAGYLSARTHADPDALDGAMVDYLIDRGVALVALAGYMKKLGPRMLAAFDRRIVNIHPSLLPKFGGKGMFGRHVHDAVLAAGETVTGVTVHLVNPHYDQGAILGQSPVPVYAGDTSERLARRVLAREHQFYPAMLRRICCGEIDLDAGG